MAQWVTKTHRLHPENIMNENKITSIATERNPAIVGMPSCAATANRQGFKRFEPMITIDSECSFSGSNCGYPSNSHPWSLGTGIIREGQQMA